MIVVLSPLHVHGSLPFIDSLKVTLSSQLHFCSSYLLSQHLDVESPLLVLVTTFLHYLHLCECYLVSIGQSELWVLLLYHLPTNPSFACFNIHSLSLNFAILIILCLGMDSLGLILLRGSLSSGMDVCFFSQIFSHAFSPVSSLLSFWGPYNANVITLDDTVEFI